MLAHGMLRRILLRVTQVGSGSLSAQIRWAIEPLSLVSCSFNSSQADDRRRHGSLSATSASGDFLHFCDDRCFRDVLLRSERLGSVRTPARPL
jgi:hypothetical protein